MLSKFKCLFQTPINGFYWRNTFLSVCRYVIFCNHGKHFNCAHLEGKMEMTFFYLKNPCSIMLSKKLLITSLYNYINIIKRSH